MGIYIFNLLYLTRLEIKSTKLDIYTKPCWLLAKNFFNTDNFYFVSDEDILSNLMIEFIGNVCFF